ncbi:MAG: zinc ribbon domain-containing protein [Candidatus Heimdallarchaeaceae archaeon]
MRFRKWIFYTLTVVFAIIGLAIFIAGDSIFALPDDFHSTREERTAYYPSSWRFGGSFSTYWELIDTDGVYVYFDATTTHSYTLHFSIELAAANTVDITFTSISTDSRGYGVWFFNIKVMNMNGGASLGYIYDYTSSQTINVPELEGYRFELSVEYAYIACIASVGDECTVIDILVKDFVRTSTLNFNSYIWEDYKEAYKQLTMTIVNALIFLVFTLEYALNFKERKKVFKIINGISYGANGSVFVYSLVNLFIAVSRGTIVGLSSPTFLIFATIIIHFVINFVEGRKLKTQKQKQRYHRSVYSQPVYQDYFQTQVQAYQPIVQQETTTTSQEDLSSSKTCLTCGNQVGADAKFCTNCGSLFD